jgi:hypothetical protein
MKVYTKDIKRQAKLSLAWVSETDSILIKGKRERFLKCQTECLKRFDGMKLNRRKYISISEVISLSYTRLFAIIKSFQCECVWLATQEWLLPVYLQI